MHSNPEVAGTHYQTMLQYNYLFNILTNNIKQHQRQKHYSSSTYSIRLPQLWHCHIIFIDTNPRVWHFISAWAIWNETTKRTPKVQNSRAAMLGIQSSNLQVAKSNAYRMKPAPKHQKISKGFQIYTKHGCFQE